MSKRPVLPKSELEVARIVWEVGGATVRRQALRLQIFGNALRTHLSMIDEIA
jgi:hypothetical protein